MIKCIKKWARKQNQRNCELQVDKNITTSLKLDLQM